MKDNDGTHKPPTDNLDRKSPPEDGSGVVDQQEDEFTTILRTIRKFSEGCKPPRPADQLCVDMGNLFRMVTDSTLPLIALPPYPSTANRILCLPATSSFVEQFQVWHKRLSPAEADVRTKGEVVELLMLLGLAKKAFVELNPKPGVIVPRSR